MRTVSVTAKIRTIHALMANAGIMHSKKDILYNTYAVESTTELTPVQMDDFIARLKTLQSKKKAASEEIRKGRSMVLRILSRMGIMDTTDPSVAHVPTDWKRVNAYLSDPRICGKLLYELNATELDDLARKLRAIERKEKSKNEQIQWLAKNN
jgi:predicted amidohydrolase YtcJ